MNRLILAPLFVTLLLPAVAAAHEVRPAYLELREVEPERYDVTWKQPMVGDRRLRLELKLPEACVPETAVMPELAGGALLQRWRIDCRPDGLRDQPIEISGLSRTLTDAFVRIHLQDGSALSHLLRPEEPRWVVRGEGGPAWSYLRLGVEHLLFGFDHILFVIGLAFFVRSPLRLIQTVTSFTLAHSVTLALSALDVLRLSQAPVEAVIALSILYLATELLRTPAERSSLTMDQPWLVAFAFGLLHGFGFADALHEIGLPREALALALFLFNVGIEIGQILIVTGLLAVLWAVRRTHLPIPVWVTRAPLYAMGAISSYWLIERVARLGT